MGGKTINDLSTITSLGGTEKFPVSVDGSTLNSITFDSINRYTTGVNISNCITKIPQDIHIQQSGEKFIVKSGTKVYDLKGNSYVIPNDLEYTMTYTSKVKCYIIMYKTGALVTIATTDQKLTITDNKVMYDTQECWLPLGMITRNTSGLSTVDQVFNGFGYINSTMFALPGVEGLIPNGRTNLGQLTSINLKLNSVVQSTFGITTYSGPAIMYLKTPGFIFQALDMYDPVSNTMTDSLYSGSVQSARIYITSGKITSMDNIIPIKYVDHNDFNRITNTLSYDYVIEQNISGANWYRKWKSGWLEQGGYVAGIAQDYQACVVTFNKPFSSTNYYFTDTHVSSNSTGISFFVVGIKDKKTTSVTVYNFRDYTSGIYWYACGR